MKHVCVWWVCLLTVVAGLGVAELWAQSPLPTGEQERVWMRVTPTPGSRVLVGSEAMEQMFWRGMRLLRCAYYTLVVCHVLLAIWVWRDIRKRGNRHWLFVVLTLLGGFCAAAVYALVRLGDKPA